MLDTHLKKINSDFENLFETFLKSKTKKSFFHKKAQTENEISSYINNITKSCYVCNRIEETFERYIDTFFYMWKNKPEIKEYVENSNGFCLEHFSMLLQKGEKLLSETEYFEFCKMILPIQEKNFKRLEENIYGILGKLLAMLKSTLQNLKS